jgi:hypothetical protein
MELDHDSSYFLELQTKTGWGLVWYAKGVKK